MKVDLVKFKELNAKNSASFNKLFSKNPVIIYYYMKGCPWCVRLDPIWRKFKNVAHMSNKQLIVIKVETQNKELLSFEPDANMFPTIKLYNKGKELSTFEEERSVDNLVNFVKAHNLLSKIKKERLSKKKKFSKKKRPSKKKKSSR
jgi:thioredoxin-like negative regulator of GroEL